MSLRELVDGINQHILMVDSAGEIRVAFLRGVQVNTKNEIQRIVVDEGNQRNTWTEWHNAVFVKGI